MSNITSYLKSKRIAIAYLCFATLSCTIISFQEAAAQNADPFIGNWAMILPDGAAAWLSFYERDDQFAGEIWTVGSPNGISEIHWSGDTLHFRRRCAVGDPNYPGGPPTGEKILVQHHATVRADSMIVVMERSMDKTALQKLPFSGKRLPALPPRPDMSSLTFGEPIELFNGKDLRDWKLTNPKQINGWRAESGILVNETPKLNFDPYSKYGNLQTEGEFMDFNLKLDFNVPKGGNSGIYLKGRYEAQVVDRDSRMQGIQGVGAVFGRIMPSENAGRPGGEWQTYDITLVDRHVTVILNGTKVIDNEPLIGATKGALNADDTEPGPICFQGDHTSVMYRNIILTPILHSKSGDSKTGHIPFGDLDSDGNNSLIREEIPEVNWDAFEHVDVDYDLALNAKQYSAYGNFLKRLADEKRMMPIEIEEHLNIPYVTEGHGRQMLDLYLPANRPADKLLPLVVWVHGGGWQRGTKQLIGKQSYLLKNGFALASINYRLSSHAIFPAQIHDCKAAIRFLREHAHVYGFDGHQIGVWGSSAGGHLVALLGTSSDIQELEGNLGSSEASSRVQAVCDWFGPSNLTRMDMQQTVSALSNEKKAKRPIPKLIGGLIEDNLSAATEASPLTYVSEDDPPFLIMHGDQDPLVPLEQSIMLRDALDQADVNSELIIVKGAKHAFFTETAHLDKVVQFFQRSLMGK